MRWLGLGLFGLHTMIGLSGYAQNTIHFRIKQFDQQSGLESYNIRKVTEDGYGFIWVAHQEGINRFDGKEFIKINRLSSGGTIADKDTRDIAYDSLHACIWALEGEERLLKIDPITGLVIQSLRVPKKRSDDWNICMLVDGDNIWIGAFSGVKRFNIMQQDFTLSPGTASSKTGEEPNEIRSLLKDNHGRIWAFSSGAGYDIFSEKGSHISHVPGVSTTASICRVWNSCLFQNSILLATSRGLFRILGNDDGVPSLHNLRYEKIKTIKDGPAYAIAAFPGNNAMIASGKFWILDNQFKAITEVRNHDAEIDDWFQSVRSIYVSKAGFVWLSSLKGLLQLSPRASPIEAFRYDERQVRKLGHVYGLAFAKDSLFIATENNLLTLRNGYLSHSKTKSYSYLLPVGNRGVLGSADGNTEWIAGGTGLPIPSLISKGSFNSCVSIGDSICILGSDNYRGIYSWDFRSGLVNIISKASQDSLAYNLIKCLFLDSRNNLWVLSNNGISMRASSESRFKAVLTGLPFQDSFNLYFDICEAAGDYWIAVHQRGIIRLDANYRLKRWYTQKDGLCNNGVYRIMPIGDTAIYITTNHGLSVMHIKSAQFTNFFVTDGLHSNAFEEACGITAGGKIYGGGLGGFSVIDPTKFSTNSAGPVTFIKRISIELPGKVFDTTNLDSRYFSIPSNVIQTTLYFSALNFSNPTRTTLSYRIKELNADWISIGSQNFINLIGIAPGEYTLQLQAHNEDGFAGPVRQIRLYFGPKWFQTFWFKGLLSILGIGIISLFFWLRVRQLRREQAIRMRLANDLHDDLGSTLNSVKMFAHLASTEQNASVHIERIKQGSVDAIRGLRDIIWIMDDKKNSVADLVQRLWQFAEPLCNAHGITLKKELDEEVQRQVISLEERRNLYLIIKEAINNALKYARAKNLLLVILIADKKLYIRFSDDGTGFNPEQVMEGNGLRNMQLRASQIHYKLAIDTQNGTIVSLTRI